MRIKPRLLDLCCKAGGASEGYRRAGFAVTGLDIEPQPKYPNNMKFIQGEALQYLVEHGHEYDIIAGSPPCQAWTTMSVWGKEYKDIISEMRELMIASGKPYIIENVVGAPLRNPIMLCGTMFGLNIIRHRIFETNLPIHFAPASCCHNKRVVKHGRRPDREKNFAAATGHFSDVEFVKEAMGIDWMGQAELAQAIPPAYTEWLGTQFLRVMEGAA